LWYLYNYYIVYMSWLGKMAKLLFIFFFFFFSLTTQKRVQESVTSQVSLSHSHIVMSHDKSHDGYGKIVHRLCSSCISSIQEIKENSIEFFLLTWTWRMIKLSRLSCYTRTQYPLPEHCLPWTLLTLILILFNSQLVS